jgi:hypothetical protein
MKILQRKRDGHLPQTKIQKRIGKLSTPELIGWVEASLFAIGRDTFAWQKNHDKAIIDELEMGAEALLEIMRELKRRS